MINPCCFKPLSLRFVTEVIGNTPAHGITGGTQPHSPTPPGWVSTAQATDPQKGSPGSAASDHMTSPTLGSECFQFPSGLLVETQCPALQAQPGGQKSVISPQAAISIHFTLILTRKYSPLSFSINVARLRSRKQKIKVSHDFRMQEKLIKAKFSQNVKS